MKDDNSITPIISICIPVYNGELYLRECIYSVLNQTYSCFELIILDNASTDRSLSVIESIIQESCDPRIILKQNNRTLPMADNWNMALTYARGHYIKLLPCDDLLKLDCLEIQTRILEQFPNVILVGSSRELVNNTGKRIFVRNGFGKSGLYQGSKIGDSIINSTINSIGEPGACLFRRGYLTTTSVFDTNLSYYVDLDWWLTLLKNGDFYFIKKPLVCFRIHGASATSKSKSFIANEFYYIYKKHTSKAPTLWLLIKLHILFNLRFLIYKTSSIIWKT